MRFWALVLLVLAASTTARAQDVRVEGREVIADRFTPHRFSDSIMFVKGTRSLEHLKLHSSMFLGFQEGPVNNYITPETDHIRIGSLVGRRYGGELNAVVGILGKGEAGMSLPFVARQFRAAGADIAYGDLDSTAIGDPLLHGKYTLFNTGPWTGAALASLSIPIGSGDAYAGRDGFGGQLGFALGWELDDVRLIGNVDYVAVSEVENISVPNDDEVQLSAGVAYTFGEIPLGVDLAVMHVTDASSPWGSLRGATGTEVIGGMRYPVDTHFEVSLGGGISASEAFGIPSWRAFAGVRALGFDLMSLGKGSSESAPNTEVEGDIEIVEPSENDVAGLAVEETPPDNPEPAQVQPVEEPVEELVEAPPLAPVDQDEDGLPDKQDVCPTVSGSLSNAGCDSPQRFALDQGGVVVLAEEFQFRQNRPVPTPRSLRTLEEIAQRLSAHSSIATLTVTLRHGPRARDAKLAERRLFRVTSILTSAGIASEQLVANAEVGKPGALLSFSVAYR
ncbi:MAG: hypothetical protein AAF654_03065 [Myxococcota bacterium]